MKNQLQHEFTITTSFVIDTKFVSNTNNSEIKTVGFKQKTSNMNLQFNNYNL